MPRLATSIFVEGNMKNKTSKSTKASKPTTTPNGKRQTASKEAPLHPDVMKAIAKPWSPKEKLEGLIAIGALKDQARTNKEIEARIFRPAAEKRKDLEAAGWEVIYSFDGIKGALIMDKKGNIAWELHGELHVEGLTLQESVRWFQFLKTASNGWQEGDATDRWYTDVANAV